MIVAAIIGILLVALMPVLNSLSRSGGRKGAISGLMNAMEHARALAVTSGRATYVVFADHNTPEAYRCRAYIIFHEDENFEPRAITKWYQLPNGVAFRPNSGLLAAQTGTPPIQFALPGDVSNAPMALPFIKFESSGMVAAPDGGLWVDVFAGFVNQNGQQTFTDKQQQASGRYDAVVVARFSGRVRYVNPYG
jgi:type II secretory pathway pseudopilin PulG